MNDEDRQRFADIIKLMKIRVDGLRYVKDVQAGDLNVLDDLYAIQRLVQHAVHIVEVKE